MNALINALLAIASQAVAGRSQTDIIGSIDGFPITVGTLQAIVSALQGQGGVSLATVIAERGSNLSDDEQLLNQGLSVAATVDPALGLAVTAIEGAEVVIPFLIALNLANPINANTDLDPMSRGGRRG